MKFSADIMNDSSFHNVERLKMLCAYSSESAMDELVTTFRELRLLATTFDISCAEGGFTSHISDTINFLVNLSEANCIEKDAVALCLHIGCQFISNLAAANHDTCSYIWSVHNKDLEHLFMNGNMKMKNSLSLLYINALNNCKEEFLKIILNNSRLLNLICDEIAHGLECPKLLIERLLSCGELNLIYEQSNEQCLYIMLSLLEDALKSDLVKLSEREIKFVLAKFKCMSTHILNNSKEISPDEFAGVLGVVVALSSDEGSLPICQEDTSLAIDCIYSLKAIHSCEKTGIAPFDPGVHKYKCSLIRIIGNLCWECKKIQDLVRENHCIPVILECCRIDMSNPFINEWSIFAIRNLCINNLENQESVASIKPDASLTELILSRTLPSVNQS